jgi:hypothetical protein
LWAIDRQLKQIDFLQRRYFARARNELPHGRLWLMLPDPVFAFGAPSRTGVGMVTSLELDLDAEPHFVLSGDIHHYERLEDGPTLHVTSGGGGAFLHPACLPGSGRLTPRVSWPGPRASARLLRQVPWKVALGRSGLIPHLLLLALYAPGILAIVRYGPGAAMPGLGVVLVLVAVVLSFLGGIRSSRKGVIGTLATLAAMLIASVPVAAAGVSTALAAVVPQVLAIAMSVVLAVLSGALVFGAYLALLTRYGLEQTQAFTALDHPGYKQFLRIRVRQDGRVDAWCIGKVDPLSPRDDILLVDSFGFDPG